MKRDTLYKYIKQSDVGKWPACELLFKQNEKVRQMDAYNIILKTGEKVMKTDYIIGEKVKYINGSKEVQ